MTFFKVIDQVFLIFTLSFQILRIFFTVSNVVYHNKNTISEKNSLTTPICLLCSCFRARTTILLLKILGGTNALAVPPPQISGDRPPSLPLGLRPCLYMGI